MKKYILIFIISICFTKSSNLLIKNKDIKQLEGYLLFNNIFEDYEKVQNYLWQIEVVDQDIYERDRLLLEYWSYLDNKMTLNKGVAPDGLPNSANHAFVVLGYALNPDGSINQEAMGRCDVAYESAIKYPNSFIFLTGGGTAKENKDVTEGGQMKEYLVNVKGLDEKRIILETKAMDTIENAKNTIEKLTEYNIKSITVITSDYHIRRANLLFKGEIMLMAEKNGIYPIQILNNAVYETGKETEGKLIEGYALGSILEIKYPIDLILKHLPEIIVEVVKFLVQRFLN